MTTDDFGLYLQNRLIQTSQTGGQQYSDTPPFSIPWRNNSLTGPISANSQVQCPGLPTKRECRLSHFDDQVQTGGQQYSDTSPL